MLKKKKKHSLKLIALDNKYAKQVYMYVCMKWNQTSSSVFASHRQPSSVFMGHPESLQQTLPIAIGKKQQS